MKGWSLWQRIIGALLAALAAFAAGQVAPPIVPGAAPAATVGLATPGAPAVGQFSRRSDWSCIKLPQLRPCLSLIKGDC